MLNDLRTIDELSADYQEAQAELGRACIREQELQQANDKLWRVVTMLYGRAMWHHRATARAMLPELKLLDPEPRS